MDQNIIGPHYSSDQFSWTKETKVLSAYASDLAPTGSSPKTSSGRSWTSPLGQLFADAADEGLVIDSKRTGKSVAFYVDKVDTDGEGEVAGWWLKPYRGAEAMFPVPADAAGVRVLIIND